MTDIRKRVKCSECGKVTAARLPRDGRLKGDGSAWFPRRHNVNGEPCPGNFEFAEIINDPNEKRYDVEISGSGSLHEIRESLKLLLIDLNNTYSFESSIAESEDNTFGGEIPPLVIDIALIT